jgi:hypothetical protein
VLSLADPSSPQLAAAALNGLPIRDLAIDGDLLLRQLGDGRLGISSLLTPATWSVMPLPAATGAVRSFAVSDGLLAVVSQPEAATPRVSLFNLNGGVPQLLASGATDGDPALFRGALSTSSSDAADIGLALAHRNGNSAEPLQLHLLDRSGSSFRVVEVADPVAAGLPAAAPRCRVTVTAYWHPQGVLGLLYWYALVPAHLFIFKGMTARMARRAEVVEQRTRGAVRAP